MQTNFTAEQLAEPKTAEANAILRHCVHCGFCNSTCPTFNLLGDELDGPRGRIYLVKDLLEKQTQPSDTVVRHLDRCLSCYACMTTCPSGVDYMHLIDTGREYIENNYKRPPVDALCRQLLAFILPRPGLLRVLIVCAPLLKIFQGLLPKSLRHADKLSHARTTAAIIEPPGHADNSAMPTVGLLTGCVQSVMGKDINAATVNILRRHGIQVDTLNNCCAAIEQHLGKTSQAKKRMLANVADWQNRPVSALLVNASGCGTQLKDYGHLLQAETSHAAEAKAISNKTQDISEYLQTLPLKFDHTITRQLTVAYHSPCSMQHGQKIHEQPPALLEKAGFSVVTLPEAHLCCGSAGTYNILHADIAEQLAKRQAEQINHLPVDVVATGNLGCLLQLQPHINVPIVHTVALLDWASGGSKPHALSR